MIKLVPPPPLVPLLLCASMALGLSGCGSGDEPGADPGALSTSATSPEAPGSTSPTAETGPEPEVEPATGPRVRLPALQIRLPDDGWDLSSVDGGFGSGIARDGTGQILVNQFPDIASNPDLDRLTRIRLQQVKENEPFPVAIGEDLTLDGVPARIIEGSGDGVHVSVLKSLVLVPEQLTLTLEMRTTGSAALHRERVESVLASWQWR